MRILLFTSQYEGVFGSVKSMIQLVKVLDETPGNDCTVLTIGRGKLGELLDKEGIAWDWIPMGPHAAMTGGKLRSKGWKEKIRAARDILVFQFRLFRYIRRQQFDIVYANNPGSFARIHWAARLNRAKTITYVRSAVRNDYVTRLTVKKSRSVITIADSLLEDLPKEFLERHKTKIHTIYTGFDFDSFDYKTNIKGLSQDKVKIGYVASLTPRKGIDFLIRLLLANRKLADKIQLVIAGDYSHGNENYSRQMSILFQQMNENSIDYVYLGFQDNVHAVYNSVDIVVLPSQSEGLPRVVIEAMAHGCAVIANNVGGTGQIITDNVNGFLTVPGDRHEWHERITRLVLNKNCRNRLAESAISTVHNQFSLLKFEKSIRSAFS